MGSRATSSLVTPVILCGGSGTRLWPLSRAGFPKQFLVLSGEDSNQSLFQQALTRINAIGNPQIDLSPSFGSDITIAELAQVVCYAVGFQGKIGFDASRPD
jgi:hypothetical protein